VLIAVAKRVTTVLFVHLYQEPHMRKVLKASLLPAMLLATVGVAAAASVKPAVEESTGSAPPTCLYYQYWQYQGGTIICYGANGNACAVCAQ